jgi:hypothetical protein
VRRGAQSESDCKCKADGVDDEVGEAPVSAERREVDVHVIAPFAQVVVELKVDKVGGIVEREVGYVDSYRLARTEVDVAAQVVSGGV